MKTIPDTVIPPAPLHGLLAWLEDTRVALPLKGVEATFSVRGDLAGVQLDQIYHQDRNQVLDVTYTFPLPQGAAVHRCELHVNGRVIAARVEEVEEARRIAGEKKAAGHRTALVETVRENLFELALGNLAPGDTVVVRLCWVMALDRLGGEWSLRIPFCPGIRYIPGKPLLRRNLGAGTSDDTDRVPDASRLSPPRMDALHPDAAYVSLEGTVDLATSEAGGLRSPTHTLLLREAEGLASVTLGDRAAVPDRDFVLTGRDAAMGTLQPAAWLCEGERGTHALIRAVAPADMASSDDAAQDVYFLVDRSGSMEGVKWTATCKALRTFLSNLAPQDRAWITWFESSWQDMAERPLPPAALLAEPAMKALEQWGTAGGTELLPALEHVLEVIGTRSRSRRVVMVLITDGQVGNEAEVLALMKKHPERRVFTFGIDTVVNDAFLRKLATQQRGSCHLAVPEDDLAAPIVALATRLRRPVLTDLAPGPGWEFPAEAPPDLLAGEALSLLLRRTVPGASLAFSGLRADGTRVTVELDARREEPATGIGLLWARRRIDFLLEAGQKAEALALAKEANLLCDGAAFLAWDEAERLAVKGGAVPVYQPAMEPALWEGAAAGCIPAAPWMAPMPATTLITGTIMPRQSATPSEKAGDSIFSLPARMVRKITKMRRKAMEPSEDLGREPSDEELKEETGVSREMLAQLQAAHARSLASGPPKIIADEEFGEVIGVNPGRPAPVKEAAAFLTGLYALQPSSGQQWAPELGEWLEQCMLSDPALREARTQRIQELIDFLAALPEEQRTAFLKTWLVETFKEQPAFLRGCLAALA